MVPRSTPYCCASMAVRCVDARILRTSFSVSFDDPWRLPCAMVLWRHLSRIFSFCVFHTRFSRRLSVHCPLSCVSTVPLGRGLRNAAATSCAMRMLFFWTPFSMYRVRTARLYPSLSVPPTRTRGVFGGALSWGRRSQDRRRPSELISYPVQPSTAFQISIRGCCTTPPSQKQALATVRDEPCDGGACGELQVGCGAHFWSSDLFGVRVSQVV